MPFPGHSDFIMYGNDVMDFTSNVRARAAGDRPQADLAQFWQIVRTLADAEVVAVVDGGLGTQGLIFLVILFDPRVLVIDVQGWVTS